MNVLSLNNLTNIIDGLVDIKHGKDCSYGVESSCEEEKIPKTISEVIGSAARNSFKLIARFMANPFL